ncbi:MAG: hypothetical protein MUF48_00970 [Pirellulaceae bacterium]|nr:hypothetical protein [Pirellulaceae bacterium]
MKAGFRGTKGWILGALLLLAGCRRSVELDVAYGQRQGLGARSVNGTSVLADIFVRAGARVLTWRTLSPQLARYDAILWAPDEFGPPPEQVRDFVDGWCSAGSGKTFVYIGRDYDAAVHYWQQVAVAAPDAERLELQRRAARAAAQYDCDRLAMPAQHSGPWFDMQRDRPPRRVTRLAGPWSAGLSAAEADIRLRGCLVIPTRAADLPPGGDRPGAGSPGLNHEVLLSDGEQPLVTRVTAPGWGTSQLIIVTNGSFLLNLPLVNPAHRVLASRLVQTCGPPGRVAFLESGRGGPRTFELATATDPPASRPERVLVAVQWLVLGVVYCLSIFPIFGRARPLPEEHPAQFVQHVDALAELLEKSHDLAFAQRQIQQYESAARREATPAGTGPTAAASRAHPAAPEQSSLHPEETP